MDVDLIRMLALIGGLVASRFVSESGLKLLSDTEKARLIDGFSTMRLAMPVFALGLVSLAIAKPGLVSSLSIVVLSLALLVGLIVLSIRRIQALDLPRGYLIRHVSSQGIMVVAIVVYLAFAP